MNIDKELLERSEGACELCKSKIDLQLYIVKKPISVLSDNQVVVCSKCNNLFDSNPKEDENHWRCLSETVWSEVAAVKVLSVSILNKLSGIAWVEEISSQVYLEDENVFWVEQLSNTSSGSTDTVKHLDSNGVQLFVGDTVTIIKDLNVKGSSIVAKRGTAVRNIALVHDNPEYIEGKVNGQVIVLLTKYVKK
ncbi:MAG: PhnA domain-containing protein [Bacteroidales bacterium]|nr:PhnA domain-containing protein [Bacteroidales bacterium]